MQITILGTGTSQGVPVIACECEVCQSNDPKDKRLRCAIHIQAEDTNIVVDAGPDFRQQMLRAKINSLDAILLTHEHTDHMIGMDDVRAFNFLQKRDMPIYCSDAVQADLRKRFAYAFSLNPYPGVPRFQLMELEGDRALEIGGIVIQPIPVIHGNLDVHGFRIGDFAYITDVNHIPPSSWKLLEGTQILILSALHHREHHAHYNLKQALEVIERLAPNQAFLTHISHNMGRAEGVNATLPDNVRLGYDGQTIIC